MQDETAGPGGAWAAIERAYPGARRRAHAVRWLGWVAFRMGGADEVSWWEPAAWVPVRHLALARWAAVLALVTPLCVLSVVTHPGVFFLLFLAGPRTFRSLTREPAVAWPIPKALDYRRVDLPWWQPSGDSLRRLGRVALGVVVPSCLRRMWGASVGDGSMSTRRIERRNDLVHLAVWTIGAAEFALVAELLFGGDSLPAALLLLVSAVVVLAFLTRPSLTDVWLAEAVLAVQWRDLVRFRALLRDAERRGVLRHPASGEGHGYRYVFTDAEVRAWLGKSHGEVLTERAGRKAAQAARPGKRSTLLRMLTDRHIKRIGYDFALGVMAGLALLTPLLGIGWPAKILVAAFSFLPGLLAFLVVLFTLNAVVGTARWTLANIPTATRPARLLATGATLAAGTLLVVRAGGFLAALLAATLPALFSAVCAVWLCALVHVRCRGSRRKLWRRASDAVAVLGTAVTAVAVLHREVMTTLPAAGLLFPIGVWLSVKAWRRMLRSDRLAVKAGADVVLAVLLGGVLVLVLVWAANVWGMSPTTFAGVRRAAVLIGAWADLPWWIWSGAFALLAVLSVVLVVAPARAGAVRRWVDRLRLVPVLPVLHRVLNGVHISLLAVVLAAVAVPRTLTPTLSRQLTAAYTVALQREIDAETELAAYRELAAVPAQDRSLPMLRAIVLKIHDVSPPTVGHDQATATATATERELARRLGLLQARTLALPAATGRLAVQVGQAEEESSRAQSSSSSHDLGERLDTEEAQEHRDEDAEKRADQAGDFAAAALAQTLSIPNLGENEVVQIVREYLTGLLEDSRIKNVFADRFSRLAPQRSGSAPSDVSVVEPDPNRLYASATADLSGELTAHGLPDPVSEPWISDPALDAARGENSLDAAVDIANQARFVHDDGHGPCAGCAEPHAPGDEHGGGIDFHEPHIP